MACRTICSFVARHPPKMATGLVTRRFFSSSGLGHATGEEPHNDVQFVAQFLANAKRTCTEVSMKDMKPVTSIETAYDVQTAICYIVTKFSRHVKTTPNSTL